MNNMESNFKIGDEEFFKAWSSMKISDQKSAEKILKWLFHIADFKTGEDIRNLKITDIFSSDLSPKNFFWRDFAHLVQTAFPKGLVDENLSESEIDLAKRTHQFRYLIDEQIVFYVRRSFRLKELRLNDSQKLAAYLSSFPETKKFNLNLLAENKKDFYWAIESARLHEKISLKDLANRRNFRIFRPNLKIVIDFHIEFVLDSQGNFLYILGSGNNGPINGASYNFADYNDSKISLGRSCNHENSRHFNLDIEPIKYYDPLFRSELLKNYRAPTLKEFKRSPFFHHSIEYQSKRAALKFERMVNKSSVK